MHYYIDGYNLLFRVLKAGEGLRKQREVITIELEKKIQLLELNATLVFDSHYQEDDNTRSHFNSLEIIFTAKGETADEYILQELKESSAPAMHTVITSDKKLARLCQLRLGKTESVEAFLGWLGKRYRNKLRQSKLETTKTIPSLPVPPTMPLQVQPIQPNSQDSAQNCFSYYLEIFEKENLIFEQTQSLSSPKKAIAEPKKPKVKKRVLSKEEQQLSDVQRWQKAFEGSTFDADDNFVID